jgi:hypothetical protein
VSKLWQPYAQHVLDAIAKIRRIEVRGDLMQDEVLYDATLRNLQTLTALGSCWKGRKPLVDDGTRANASD